MKTAKFVIKLSLKSLAVLVTAVVLILTVLLTAITANSYFVGKKYYNWQTNHLTTLQTTYENSYSPVNEQVFTQFEIDENPDTPLNELQFMGTHNSYKMKASPISKIINHFTAGVIENKDDTTLYDYVFEPISNQLDSGIRSFELDILANKNGTFPCSHHAFFDNASSCLNFELAVKELKLWSDANPDHMPITVLVELKNWLLPIPGTKDFDVETMRALDKIIREAAGDSLYRPADMLKDCETMQQALDVNGWPTLSDVKGKIMFILHPDSITEDYISSDMTMQSQSFFPMLKGDMKVSNAELKTNTETWQNNVIMFMCNSPVEQFEDIKALKSAGYFVRTRSDSYRNFDSENISAAIASGANIISSDYPEFSDGGTMMDSGLTVKISSKYTVALTQQH